MDPLWLDFNPGGDQHRGQVPIHERRVRFTYASAALRQTERCSRKASLIGGSVRPDLLMMETGLVNQGSSIGFDGSPGSALISRAEPGRMVNPSPARTMPTAVIM